MEALFNKFVRKDFGGTIVLTPSDKYIVDILLELYPQYKDRILDEYQKIIDNVKKKKIMGAGVWVK